MTRLIYPRNDLEENIMGKYTMHKNTIALDKFNEGMIDNRDRMMEFATTNSLKICNTMYKKPLTKLATYRKEKSTNLTTEVILPQTHEQLDYWAVTSRWKNTVTNMESDTQANIHTDHYQVIGIFITKLRKNHTGNRHRHRYTKCSKEENQTLNNNLHNQNNMIPVSNIQNQHSIQQPSQNISKTQVIKNILKRSIEDIPKENKKDRFRKALISIKSLQLLRQRGRARKE